MDEYSSEHVRHVMSARKKELLDNLAKHIWLTISATSYSDDRGSIDHWTQDFLTEYFDAEFPNGV